MFKFAENKQSIQEIWKSSLNLYKATIKKIWYLAFIAMLLASLDVGKKQISASMHPAAGAHVTSHASLLFYVFIGLLIFIVNIVISALVLDRMYNLVKDNKYSINRSVSQVLKRIVVIFLSMLLYAAMVYLGIILLIAPGIFALVTFAFILPLILFDDCTLFEAFKKSYKLVWGNWWNTFAIIIVPVVLFGIIHAVFSRIATHLHFINTWIYILLSALLLSFLKPFIDAVILVQFKNLKLNQKVAEPPPEQG